MILNALPGPSGDVDGLAVLVVFALCSLLLEYFDISLPRGDSLGVSGALHSAALVLLGPLYATVAAAIGTALAIVLRGRFARNSSMSIELPALAGAFGVATLVDVAARLIIPVGGAAVWRAALVAASFLAAEMTIVQVLVASRSTRSALWLIRGNAVRQAPLLLAEFSSSVLAVIIFPSMGLWSLVLVVVLLLLIRQSYAMLLDIRETYRTTVEVLVEAAERSDERLAGHAERTAELAREIAARCGLAPSDLERVSYAALLHDVGAIGAGAQPSPSPGGSSSIVLGASRTFEDVVRVLQVLENSPERRPSDSDLMAAFVVALSSDIDASLHPRVADAHPSASLSRVGALLPPEARSRALAAAVRLGFDLERRA